MAARMDQISRGRVHSVLAAATIFARAGSACEFPSTIGRASLTLAQACVASLRSGCELFSNRIYSLVNLRSEFCHSACARISGSNRFRRIDWRVSGCTSRVFYLPGLLSTTGTVAVWRGRGGPVVVLVVLVELLFFSILLLLLLLLKKKEHHLERSRFFPSSGGSVSGGLGIWRRRGAGL